MNWSIADGISLSLLPVFLVILAATIYDPVLFWIVPVTILLTVLSVELMKPFIPSKRPEEASDCDLLCMNGSVGGQPGFPSGHMAMTTSIVTFLYHFFPSSYSLSAGLLYIVAMAYSRYTKHCHTPTQILAGTLYGFLCASITILISESKAASI